MASVAIIVPNYNCERFLAECIDSVLSQGVDVDCLVMDGGSSDGSVEILKGYGDRIRWVSEQDEGQADAIDKGLCLVSAPLVGWLNSDDMLEDGALSRILDAARERPDAVLFHGDLIRIDAEGEQIAYSVASDLEYEKMRRGLAKTIQPGSIYRAEAVRACGGVDKRFHLLMDVDLWIRLLRIGPAARIHAPLARFRVHEDAKSSQAPYRYYRESLWLALLHERDRLAIALVRRCLRIALNFARYEFRKLRTA